MATDHPKERSPKFQDITGQRFGRWLVLELLETNTTGHSSLFLCRCDCGAMKPVHANSLQSKRSVGCRACGHRKHGCSRIGSRTPEYNLWLAMKGRCAGTTNPRTNKNYRDRGITVCQRWRESFAAFLADMGERPHPDLSLDRIDNDSGYTCGQCKECTANGWTANVRWATKIQQSRNTHSNHWITYDGRTLTITQWSRETGIDIATILYRMRAGWSLHETFTIPRRHGNRRNRAK
jgi:hypothetical protein